MCSGRHSRCHRTPCHLSLASCFSYNHTRAPPPTLGTRWGLCPVSRSPNPLLPPIWACSPDSSFPSLQQVSDMGCQIQWSPAVLEAKCPLSWDLPGRSGHSHPDVPFLNLLLGHVPSLSLCISPEEQDHKCDVIPRDRKEVSLQPMAAWALVGVGPLFFQWSSKLICDCLKCLQV